MEVGWLLERRLKPLGGSRFRALVLQLACSTCTYFFCLGSSMFRLHIDPRGLLLYFTLIFMQAFSIAFSFGISMVRNSMTTTTWGSPSEDLPVRGPQDAGAHHACLLKEKRK